MKGRGGMGGGSARRSWKRGVLTLALAAVLGLGVAIPALAADEQPEVQPQIVGGDPVNGGKYRFMAALRDTRQGSGAYQQLYCAGTLIDADSVLTAAHCIKNANVTRKNLRVTVGATVLRGDAGETREVSRIDVHPAYRQAKTRKYDAAVLTLRRSVTNVSPIGIPPATSNGFEKPGRDATIAGWGSTVKQPPRGGNLPSFPRRMRETKVPIVRDDIGKRVYGPEYTGSLMVAAGRKGKDTCQGDSGGPLFFSGRGDALYQVGITSFGTGCGARGYPGVYAETNSVSIRSFITRAVR